ncbi:Uncharacterised protein [Bordetella pertussis]|nr:Uncharacterised protein [Bordetella pertussis]CPO27097.1 Uncharacterised protein [Bordetella pertussis]
MMELAYVVATLARGMVTLTCWRANEDTLTRMPCARAVSPR